jgi:alpha-glucosidase
MLPIIRDAIWFRYKLVPYLYTLSIEAAEYGHPVIRPTMYHFQSDRQSHSQSFSFLLGPHLLVASVYKKGQTERVVYLPTSPRSETRWCNVWDGRWTKGGQEVSVSVPLEQHGALFAKEGAMIPINPTPKHCVDSTEDTEREIWIFPTSVSGGSVYVITDDLGTESHPAFFRYKVSMCWNAEMVEVSAEVIESNWTPAYESLVFVLPKSDGRTLVNAKSKATSTQRIAVSL